MKTIKIGHLNTLKQEIKVNQRKTIIKNKGEIVTEF